MNETQTLAMPAYNSQELHAQYNLDHLQPGVKFRPAWLERSEAFCASTPCQLDLSYGQGLRDHLDFFPAENAENSPALIFIHGGFWQQGDKSAYRFLGKPFVANGVSFLPINYNFCPSVRMHQISEQLRCAISWIWHNAAALGISRDKLHISGHSAGAHLAGMMMTTDWPSLDSNLPTNLFKSSTLVSGLFDLQPLLSIAPNQILKLDEAEALEQSPARRPSTTDSPQLIACGELESAEFNRQSNLYAQAFLPSSRNLERYSATGQHHFSIVNQLADPDSELFKKTLTLIRSA